MGTSRLGTLLARGAQQHQVYLAAHITGSDAPYRSTVTRLTEYLARAGLALPGARSAAVGLIYKQLGVQANLLAYVDIIRFFAYLSFMAIQFCFIVRRPQPGQGPAH